MGTKLEVAEPQLNLTLSDHKPSNDGLQVMSLSKIQGAGYQPCYTILLSSPRLAIV